MRQVVPIGGQTLVVCAVAAWSAGIIVMKGRHGSGLQGSIAAAVSAAVGRLTAVFAASPMSADKAFAALAVYAACLVDGHRLQIRTTEGC